MVSLNMITNLLNKSLFKMSLEDKRKVLRHVITSEECDNVYHNLSEKEKKQSISLVTSNDQCDTIFLTFLAKQYGHNKLSQKAIRSIKQNRSTDKIKDSIEYYISIEEDDEDICGDEDVVTDKDDDTLSELSFEDDCHNNEHHTYEEDIIKQSHDDANKQEDIEKENDNDIQVDIQNENPQVVSKLDHEDEHYVSDNDVEDDNDSLSLIESSDEYSLNEDI